MIIYFSLLSWQDTFTQRTNVSVTFLEVTPPPFTPSVVFLFSLLLLRQPAQNACQWRSLLLQTLFLTEHIQKLRRCSEIERRVVDLYEFLRWLWCHNSIL